MKHKIKILSHNKRILADDRDLLSYRIQESGIQLSAYCNKRGICGKCFVEIINGKLPPLNEREEFFIKQKKINKSHRLACLYRIKSDLVIRIPDESIILETFVLKTGIKLSILVDPPVKKYYLQLQKPKLGTPESLLGLFERYFWKKKLSISLNLLKEFQDILETSQFKVTSVLCNDNEIMGIESGDTSNKNFGIAIDVGTTTVVVELVDLSIGESIDAITASNSQMKHGADIVSRITFAIRNPENLNKLQDSILKSLNRMIKQILDKNKISKTHVYQIAVAGNTAMNHFLLGLPVNTLAVSPFHSVFTRLPELSASELGFNINKYAKVYLAPNIKSFIGGDISAGLIASDLANKKGNYLFIDLGTNGEIVLKTQKKFVATSTAAGPAFEGMNISCGMLALPGAIYKAEKRKGLKFHTLNNMPALGICGTGLIDLMAILLDTKKISANGTISHKSKKIHVMDNIYITQKDVREMQLAIAAIKSGIQMILQEFHVKKEHLDEIYIAGAFGNYLNIKNSMKIGLLPEIDDKKVIFIGNSSLAGARALLLSSEAKKEVESLIKRIQYVSLATNPQFQNHFIEALELKNWSLP